ncbi:Formate-dependent phosphoribosylglycinamide formyltransferase [Bienertia sinuspersici]
MGKASRWFRAFLGLRQPDPSPNPKQPKEKRRWSFVKSYREKSSNSKPPRHQSSHNTSDGAAAAATSASSCVYGGDDDANKHAIAVAAATAAVAEAAVAAAQAAAAVVRLTNSGRCDIATNTNSEDNSNSNCNDGVVQAQVSRGEKEFASAIVIQSHFRGYLRNSSRSNSRNNSMLCHSQQERSNPGSSWSDPRMDPTMWDQQATSSTTRTCFTDDDRADRILEIDTGKPHHTFRRRSLFEPEADHVSHTHTTSTSPVSCEVVQTLKNLVLPHEMIDDSNSYCTAESSPQYCSAASQGGISSRRGGPFTPTKSDGSRSFLSGYSDCPSYMSYTESSKAKMRSVSAPKQRPQYERTSSNKRYSIHGFGEHNPRSNAQRSAAMHASFTSKAYPGSGRLDRLGMPVRDSTVVYYSGLPTTSPTIPPP